MANYYTMTSFSFHCSIYEKEDLKTHLSDYNPEYREGQIFIHSQNTDLNYLTATLQKYCKETLKNGPIAFTWSDDCDEPRVDAFGGGYVIVGKDFIKMESTSKLLEQALKNLENLTLENSKEFNKNGPWSRWISSTV